MPDVADQIKAWADAAAPVDAVPRWGGPEVTALAVRSSRRRPPRLLAAAAVVVFVAALAGLVLAVDRDSPQSVTTGPAEGTTDAHPVTFEVLSVSDGYLNDLGVLRAASSAAELSGLWEVAGATEPVPTVDFDEQVVVSITIPDDTCPPTLEAFDRDASSVVPRFVESSGRCDDLLVIPRTYVVALDRSTTGPEFRLTLPGQPEYEFGDTFLDVGGAPPAVTGATAVFHLSADTMAAGSTIAGTVQVYNNAEESLEGGTCGPFFTSALQDDAGRYEALQAACLQAFSIPPGLSSYPVTVRASYGGCTNSAPSDLSFPPCEGSGDIPSLPAGRYEAVVVAASDVVPDLLSLPEPIPVTVT